MYLMFIVQQVKISVLSQNITQIFMSEQIATLLPKLITNLLSLVEVFI